MLETVLITVPAASKCLSTNSETLVSDSTNPKYSPFGKEVAVDGVIVAET